MNQHLADVAQKALTAPGFPSEPGLCQKFVRLCVAAALGHQAEDIVRAPSAKQAALKMLKSGNAVRYTSGMNLEAGDLLYKTQGSGGFGHVAIYLGNGRVAENSSYHSRGGGDARGIRTLSQFGPFQVVARFNQAVEHVAPPAPVHVAPPSIDFEGKLLGVQISQENGVTMAPLRGLCEALGYRVVFDKTANRVHIERESV